MNQHPVLTFMLVGLLASQPVVGGVPEDGSARTSPETRHVVVLEEPGQFVGWPANNGLWSWDNGREILVGCTLGEFNRGRDWRGPFQFGGLNQAPEQQGREQTPRTDYLPLGGGSCLVFLSSRPAGGGITADRSYVARTDDGGASFRHLAWIVPPADPFRAVMSATVLVGKDDLVTAVRRRADGDERFWIDAYFSRDGGLHWTHRAEIGSTGTGNGNPPALVKLRDGRLCCAYGDRKSRRMVVRFSADKGLTWGPERVLRDDFKPDHAGDADFGYPRVTQRPDGKLIVCYYFATAERPHAHLAATIFDLE